jgi:hypothetical protein
MEESYDIFVVVIQVVVFWVVTLCSDVVGNICFRGSCCLHIQGKDGGSMVLRNTGTL